MRGKIYQVTKVEGKLMLICKEEVKDKEVKESKDVLNDKTTTTVKREEIENLVLHPKKDPS